MIRIFLTFFVAIAMVGCSSTSTTTTSTTPTGAPSMSKPFGDKEKKIKPFTEVIPTGTKADSGLFTVYRVEEKVMYEIPVKEFGKEYLLVTRIAKTPQVGYGGEASNTEVVRWERKFDKILLRAVTYANVAADSLPIARAVHAANFEEILAAFPIQAFGKDSASVVIDVTQLFTTDIGILTPQKSLRDQYRMTMLSSDRSYVEYVHSYPINIEVENVLTFGAENSPQNQSSRTMSFTMHHSMVRLPEKPMTPRLMDWRVGFFGTYKTDYGLDVQKAERRAYILRWRLEPKDSAAYFRGELVEPVKPITYYIDPATPLKWRPWLKKGLESWNTAFEKAGFKNAIRCLYPPDSTADPEFCPEDARYSVIRYFPSPIENAYGPNVHDPRSGEIIESDIGWFHNIMNLQMNWYFTQAVADPMAHKLPFSDSLMGEMIAVVAAHEFGHTIGFPHNMKASFSYPVDSLRSPTFTKEYGTAPSIMDYARYNYIAQPGDGAHMMPRVGPYDKFAVNWGYRVLPNIKVPEDETETLNKWTLEQEKNPMFRYGDQQWITVDPSAQMEDLGDDAIKASTYGIKNIERIMGYLVDATTTNGKDYDLLDEMYNETIGQYRQEIGHVANNVGGVYGTYKNAGQAGKVYEAVPKERQKQCVAFIADKVFTTPTMFLNEEILRRIEPSGSSDRVQRLQTGVLNTLLSNDKLSRLVEYSSMNANNYTVQELFDDVEKAVFSELAGKTFTGDIYRRNLQRQYVNVMIAKITPPSAPTVSPGQFVFTFPGSNVYQTDVRAIARMQLDNLKAKLAKATGADAVTKAHIKDLMVMIDNALNPRK
ncbi:MAG: zinc-dependent metalloprotease [Bacteriodetes bacterium]|nr:zinc-dependent metalloprotease [Bacteroidota bacterium]